MLKYTTPPLLLGNLRNITRVTGEKKTHDSANLTVFTTPLALPAGLAHWAAALGSSIYPPFSLLAASAWLPSQAAPHASFITTPHWLPPSWNPLLASPPNRYGSLLLPSFLHQDALAPGLLSPIFTNCRWLLSPRFHRTLAPGILSAAPVFLASLNPLLCSTCVSC